ncbi:MAG: 5'-methylthioadenosine/S-adenosylhomocysteine nucleosidase, partial [Candidatus Methanomethylophilus sp.]|nr:5'-methylthioadenosine/S-adenosylhomocysteine nucleosidase [Methanomethylophilus sp.]
QKAVDAITKSCPEVNVYEGRICTGDQFISTDEQKDAITSVFGGMCCEMEGGAIAQVCYLNSVPFVIIRAMSDDGLSPEEYEEFKKEVAARGAHAVMYLLEHESP